MLQPQPLLEVPALQPLLQPPQHISKISNHKQLQPELLAHSPKLFIKKSSLYLEVKFCLLYFTIRGGK